MDIYEWLVEQEQETLLHLEDEQRSKTGVFEVSNRTAGFQIGDTVCIVSEDLDGQQGELKVIDPEASEGEFYGVYVEHVGSLLYFAADEIEKVEIR